MHEILTVAEMYRADALAIAAGVSGPELMENAGAGIAAAIAQRWTPRPLLVLCGPGNNGGDGFVAARRLAAAGWPVRLALAGARARLQGDAAGAAARWTGAIGSLDDPALLEGEPLVVDALFGAGLSRPLEGLCAAVMTAVVARRLPVVAVDVPSGVQGDSGAVLGVAPQADLTVTFFRCKPGHWLYPGRALCGTVQVVDIGIPGQVLDTIQPCTAGNHPALWQADWPVPQWNSHKFTRGHAVVYGGARMTGAARLAARAARRVGVGLLTLACPPERFDLYALAEPGALIRTLDDGLAWPALLADARMTAHLIGPGAGAMGAEEAVQTRKAVLECLATGRPCVLDADALTVWSAPAERDALMRALAALSGRAVLTPHAGEFARLFPAAAALSGGRLVQARAAAAESGAVLVLKGADTVIARPDGRGVINGNAPPALATAGAGDVLAGLIVGLLAQGMPAFAAACGAVWLHGAAAAACGPGGLIAEDVPEAVPGILASLWAESGGGEGVKEVVAISSQIVGLSNKFQKQPNVKNQNQAITS